MRKFDLYLAWETLFELPHDSYPELEATRKEKELLDKLYNLHSKANTQNMKVERHIVEWDIERDCKDDCVNWNILQRLN
jgi:hypothetical protein